MIADRGLAVDLRDLDALTRRHQRPGTSRDAAMIAALGTDPVLAWRWQCIVKMYGPRVAAATSPRLAWIIAALDEQQRTAQGVVGC